MRKKPRRVPQDRQLIKITVRAQLSGHILVCFLACLIPAVLPWLLRLIPFHSGTLNILVADLLIAPVSLPLYALSFVSTTFVTGPMAVRLAGFFLRLNRDAEHLPSPLTVCDCFGPGYWRLVAGMFLRSLDIIACTAVPLVIGALIPGTWEWVEISGVEVVRLLDWSTPFLLLALVVNFYRSLAYTMVPYLLEDQPYLSAMNALRASLRMTKGRIWELLVLNLSFFGWLLLTSVTLFLGAIYTYPYIEATIAAYYIAFSEPMPWELARINDEAG